MSSQRRSLAVLFISCAIVGCGTNGKEDMLAQMVIVNMEGDIIYNKYVHPTEEVTDYRTNQSGISEDTLMNDQNSVSFRRAQQDFNFITSNSVLVGHRLWKDLSALDTSFHIIRTRDVALYGGFATLQTIAYCLTLNLQSLMWTQFGEVLGPYSILEYANSIRRLYLLVRDTWEYTLSQGERASFFPPDEFMDYYIPF
ncbi:hypothetical protein DFS33DRAFT_400 [Desarmillaria ectypa]|nr:hypothetical protein DFS33DRAFT_400 [Desarmillaria ectypa]